MSTTRRQAILSALFGSGYVGLRALATGIPVSVLLNPRNSLADACAQQARAQYLIFSTSISGDPLNGNVPGTYISPDIFHPTDPNMAATEMRIGGETWTAAKPWASMPQEILDRTVFFHHTTLTNSHGNEPKVLRLMGAIKRQEMLVSLIAKNLAPCLGTVQKEPASLGAVSPGEFLSYEGRVMPALSPTGLRDVLIGPNSPLIRGNLRQIRDKHLDALNALYKQEGNTAQRAFLDRVARSQTELRSISQDLLQSLASIVNNGVDNQITAAITLIRMNVAPVVAIRIPWGGDNHTDLNLQGEANQTIAGVGSIVSMQQRLMAAGLADKVTFACMNVFGRTLSNKHRTVDTRQNGRDHLAAHHCTVLVGKSFRGSVVGGLELRGTEFAAQPIESKTGKGVTGGGDIPYAETLGAVGKTLCEGLGIAKSVYDDQITTGKVVGSALKA